MIELRYSLRDYTEISRCRPFINWNILDRLLYWHLENTACLTISLDCPTEHICIWFYYHSIGRFRRCSLEGNTHISVRTDNHSIFWYILWIFNVRSSLDTTPLMSWRNALWHCWWSHADALQPMWIQDRCSWTVRPFLTIEGCQSSSIIFIFDFCLLKCVGCG